MTEPGNPNEIMDINIYNAPYPVDRKVIKEIEKM